MTANEQKTAEMDTRYGATCKPGEVPCTEVYKHSGDDAEGMRTRTCSESVDVNLYFVCAGTEEEAEGCLRDGWGRFGREGGRGFLFAISFEDFSDPPQDECF